MATVAIISGHSSNLKRNKSYKLLATKAVLRLIENNFHNNLMKKTESLLSVKIAKALSFHLLCDR
jgi:hypothetical protein